MDKPVIFSIVRYSGCTFLSISQEMNRLELLGLITEAQYMLNSATDKTINPENLSNVVISTLDMDRIAEVIENE
jgi:hypothetical protein